MNSLNFKIEGGYTLKGEVEIKKSKNAAVALLCASLLNKGTTTLKKVPKIEEVFRIIEVLESINVSIVWKGEDLVISHKKINLKNINDISAKKTRSIIMMIGALVHEHKNFSLPNAGGCKLGSRTIAPHLYALKSFGVEVDVKEKIYNIKAPILSGADVTLYEIGDTVTENALFAAAKIPGKSVIHFASSNYMVIDVCHFLVSLGVKITGIGTHTLEIEGMKEINKDIVFEMSEDPIEAMFFVASAIVTNSEITIKKIPLEYMRLELLKLSLMGFQYKILKEYIGENGFVKLIDIKTKKSHLIALTEKIHALPYPGINMDNLPFFAVIATQAEGETFIHDFVYEKRAIYYTELDKLGADTFLADPHRIFIKGKKNLKPAEIVTPPALRPAAIILIAMLSAKGTSILRNVYSINRGYEDLAQRLKALGAHIETF